MSKVYTKTEAEALIREGQEEFAKQMAIAQENYEIGRFRSAKARLTLAQDALEIIETFQIISTYCESN